MTKSTFERALADLDARPAAHVERFDAARPLVGQVAVLPSAFNPPTLAHLHLLETACAVEPGATPAALLSTRNVAKGVFGAGLADRIGMLLAMRSEAPALAVLASNAARLVDQGRALRGTFDAATFDFVVGHDTLIRLFDPVYYDDMAADLAEFFAHHRVVATNRGETPLAEVQAFVDSTGREYAARIIVREIDAHPASLSSTAARDAVAVGEHPVAVTPTVAGYIREHGLYRQG